MIRLDKKLGDAWFFVEKDIIHAYFLQAELDCNNNAWDIGHCVSTDLYNWDYLGTALYKDDNFGLATGSVIQAGEYFYMAYTSIKTARTGTDSDWAVSMARSKDLHNWEPFADNPILHEDSEYYELKTTGSRPFNHWRDPFLFAHEGDVYMLICARRNYGNVATRGCAAVFKSRDMTNWQSLGPLDVQPFSEEMEVPQLYSINGRFYFNFSTPIQLIAEAAKSGINSDDTCGDYSFVADNFTGPYKFLSGTTVAGFTPRCEYGYAGQIVEFKGRYYYLTRILYPEGAGKLAVISDPIEVEATPEGIKNKH